MPILGQITDSAALLVRQATSAAIAATTAAAAVATAAATTAAPATDSPDPPPTASFGPASVGGLTGSIEPTSSANATSTGSSGGSGGGGGGGNSPLLFFVALGFGVVFTNLWIIVGVKYCFRYNARARQLRQAAEDGEPIGLENMPRPHRRRREKKLMTIDEVNEKFPMMKYKSWVATRAKHGLSTLGGIDVPSRANSVRSVDGAIVQHKERDSTDESEEQRKQDKETAIVAVATASTVDAGDALMHTATVTPASPTDLPVAEAASSSAPHITPVSPTQDAAAPASVPGNDETAHADDEHYHHSDDEDDEHINAALPPECIGTSGDTCAICIDTLENDDDVRGLTCGHAFHAVCLDPWLTSRRACCPLCKADYYTPKPRPAPQELADAQATGIITVSIPGHGEVRRHRINLSSRPGTSWTIFRSPGRTSQPGADAMQQVSPSGASAAPAQSEGSPTTRNFFSRRRAATGPEISEQLPAEGPALAPSTRSRRSWFSSIRPSMPVFRDLARRRGDSNSLQGQVSRNTAAAAEVTPSQLEAGVRNESR